MNDIAQHPDSGDARLGRKRLGLASTTLEVLTSPTVSLIPTASPSSSSPYNVPPQPVSGYAPFPFPASSTPLADPIGYPNPYPSDAAPLSTPTITPPYPYASPPPSAPANAAPSTSPTIPVLALPPSSASHPPSTPAPPLSNRTAGTPSPSPRIAGGYTPRSARVRLARELSSHTLIHVMGEIVGATGMAKGSHMCRWQVVSGGAAAAWFVAQGAGQGSTHSSNPGDDTGDPLTVWEHPLDFVLADGHGSGTGNGVGNGNGNGMGSKRTSSNGGGSNYPQPNSNVHQPNSDHNLSNMSNENKDPQQSNIPSNTLSATAASSATPAQPNESVVANKAALATGKGGGGAGSGSNPHGQGPRNANSSSNPKPYTSDPLEQSAWPSLLVKVFRRDLGSGKDCFVSLATVHLPRTPGFHRISARTWRPTSQDSSPLWPSRVFEWFLGLVPRLEDESYVVNPKRRADMGTRVLSVGTAGQIHLRLNIVIRQPRPPAAPTNSAAAAKGLSAVPSTSSALRGLLPLAPPVPTGPLTVGHAPLTASVDHAVDRAMRRLAQIGGAGVGVSGSISVNLPVRRQGRTPPSAEGDGSNLTNGDGAKSIDINSKSNRYGNGNGNNSSSNNNYGYGNGSDSNKGGGNSGSLQQEGNRIVREGREARLLAAREAIERRRNGEEEGRGGGGGPGGSGGGGSSPFRPATSASQTPDRYAERMAKRAAAAAASTSIISSNNNNNSTASFNVNKPGGIKQFASGSN